jgi:hypothetical protein
MTIEEFENWKSQIVTSNSDKMGLRKIPFVFTEQDKQLHTEHQERRTIGFKIGE